MPAVCAFEGCDEMVRLVDEAVSRSSVEELTQDVKEGISALIRDGRIALPGELRRPCNDHYARRLLYRSDDHGYVVVAMIWGPGQKTPLHDHAGTWCVEGVLEGQIDVTQYDLLEQEDGRARFETQDTMRTGVGASGSLIPPFEYHTIANSRNDAGAITLHIYGQEMTSCTIFEPLGGAWYAKKERALSYDA